MPEIDGIFDVETLALLRENLEGGTASLIDLIHDDANWPEINIEFRTKGRKKDRHLGKHPVTLHYREHVGKLLVLLAQARQKLREKEASNG